MSIKSWIAERALSVLKEAPSIRAAASDGRTEGWETSISRNRPQARLTSTDSEYNFGAREKMMAEARALCQTFGLPFSILRKFANYCIGNCEVDFQSGDAEWDLLAEENWRNRMRTIDITGQHDFASMAKQSLVSMLCDGDVGLLKTLDNGFPQIQPIEADRIRHNAFMGQYDTDGQVGGINVDKLGRAQSYMIWQRQFLYGFKDPVTIPAESMILLKDVDRFDTIRGITHFGRGALNHLRDLKEILKAEKTAVKINSKLAVFFQKTTGSKATNTVNLFGTKDDGSGNIYTESLSDGTMVYGFPGDSLNSHFSNRPSSTFQGFLEFIIRDIAVSLDLPIGFVWAMLGTGPAVRFESKQAERTLLAKTELMERLVMEPICAWVTTFDMQNGNLPFNPNWYRYEFQRPSHPSIDAGYDSRANMAEHERGIISGGKLAAEQGRNIYKEMEANAREFAHAKMLSEKYNVPVEVIRSYPIKSAAGVTENQTIDTKGGTAE